MNRLLSLVPRRWRTLVTVCVVLLLLFANWRQLEQNEITPEITPVPTPNSQVLGWQPNSNWLADKTIATVSAITDGDTIQASVAGEIKKIRLIGIDTPELHHPSKPVGCFAQEAKNFVADRLQNQTIFLEKDVSETDRYGRLLRYVYVASGSGETATPTLFNETLVREGYAQASSYPPDVKYQAIFGEAERIAREQKLGLWGESCVLPNFVL